MPHFKKIINLTNKNFRPFRVKYCDDFISRLRGFTFRKDIHSDEGLILAEKRDSRMDTSIHMLFVWTDLAVFWVDSTMTVVDKALAASWHPYYASKVPAKYVIELAPSNMDFLQVGDKVEFNND